jgi:hypothetical protein
LELVIQLYEAPGHFADQVGLGDFGPVSLLVMLAVEL